MHQKIYIMLFSFSLVSGFVYTGGSTNGIPSIAGWFISWNIQISNGGFRGTSHLLDPPISYQWEFQDPKMEVLYHIRPYFGGISPYIGLIYGRYLQFRFLKFPLIIVKMLIPQPGHLSPCPSTAGPPRNLRLRLGGNRLLRLPESFGQLKALRQLALEARRAWGYHGDILYVDVYKII